jgi:hypothetical protein
MTKIQMSIQNIQASRSSKDYKILRDMCNNCRFCTLSHDHRLGVLPGAWSSSVFCVPFQLSPLSPPLSPLSPPSPPLPFFSSAPSLPVAPLYFPS